MDDPATERLTLATKWLWAICGPVIFIAGLIGNTIAMWIFIKLGVTSTTANFHLFILAITDTAVLFTSLGRIWIKYVFELDVRDLSDAGCKMHQFLTYTFMDFSGWILVSLASERFISVYRPFKFRKLCTIKIASVKLVVIFIFICIINAHMLWTYGLAHNIECSITNEYFQDYDEQIFIWIDMCVLSFIPFAIMITSSVLIIHMLKHTGMVKHPHGLSTSTKDSETIHWKEVNRNSSKTRILVILATVYICLSLPNSVTYPVDAFRLKCRYCDAQWYLAWTVTYLLQFCNYAINTIIYTIQSKKFNQEMRKLICCQIFRSVYIYTVPYLTPSVFIVCLLSKQLYLPFLKY